MEYESYVSLEIAKMLKQLGFDWEVNHYYFIQNGKTEVKSDFRHPAQNYNELMATMDSKSFEFEVCSRPTLAVAQRWLREVKDMQIEPYYRQAVIGKSKYVCQIRKYRNPTTIYLEDGKYEFDTYESALEAGINKCLELLLK